jgi:hypothetical protein
MNLSETVLAGHTTTAPALQRGHILEFFQTGELLVGTGPDGRQPVLCDFLQTGPALELRTGDEVLLLPPADATAKGCVLGRIGAYVAPNRDRVVVEAEQELVLRCGDGAITLRRDGKVLTKAMDVASVAKRRQRIKGGSVQIN